MSSLCFPFYLSIFLSFMLGLYIWINFVHMKTGGADFENGEGSSRVTVVRGIGTIIGSNNIIPLGECFSCLKIFWGFEWRAGKGGKEGRRRGGKVEGL